MGLKVEDPFGVWSGTVLIGGTAAQIDGNGKVISNTIFLDDSRKNEFRLNLINMKWGNAKELEIQIQIAYKIMAEFTGPFGQGYIRLAQTWAIAYQNAGALFHAKPWRIVGKPVVEADYVLAYDIRPDQNPHEADETWASALLRVAGGHKKDGVTIGVQVGPVGASGTLAGSQGSGQLDFAFNVKCFFTGRPEKAPDPIALPEGLLRHPVWFELENQSDLGIDELRSLREWSSRLRSHSPELATAIEKRICPVHLYGYASVTGRSDDYNREISANRVISVTNALRGLFSENVMFVPNARGREAARQPGPSPQEKRVEIIINRTAAEQAIRELRTQGAP